MVPGDVKSLHKETKEVLDQEKKRSGNETTVTAPGVVAAESIKQSQGSMCVDSGAMKESESDSKPNETLVAIGKDDLPAREVGSEDSPTGESSTTSMEQPPEKLLMPEKESAEGKGKGSPSEERKNEKIDSSLPSRTSSVETKKSESQSTVETVTSVESVNSSTTSNDEDPDQIFAKKAQERVLGLLGAILPQDSKVRDN